MRRSFGVTHHCRRAGSAPHLHFRHRAFLQFERRFAARVADDRSQELAQVRIVPDHHDRFLARIFFQELAEVGESSLRAQPGVDLQFAFVAQFVAHQRRGLRAALQRAGDDRVHLNVERSQGAADIAALLDALFVEGALLVFFRMAKMLAGAGVAQKVEDHLGLSFLSRYHSTLARGKPAREALQATCLPPRRSENPAR